MEDCLQRDSARTHNRSHAWRLLAAVLAVACLCVQAASGRAAAAVTIGQVTPTTPSENCTSSNVDYLEPSVTGGNLYVARSAGTITSWTTNAAGFGYRYVIKIFRRTTDPDDFQAVAHSSSVLLSSGLNVVPAQLPVKSGDMLGLHTVNAPTSCTFGALGDNVLTRTGNISDGSSGTFAAQNDVRLNLSAVLDAANSFSLSITRDRRLGTAAITVTTSNPGTVTADGKGLRKRGSKSLAVAGPVSFQLVPRGRTSRILAHKGRVTVPVTVTFLPAGGDPGTQLIHLKLRRTTAPAPHV